MKNKILDFIPLIVFITLVSCTIQYTYINISNNYLNIRMGNMFLSQNAIYMHVSGITTDKIIQALESSESKFTVLVPQSQENVYGFFSTESVQPKLITGRHFSKKDLENGAQIALIGQNLQKEQNDTYNGNFKVVGVMGNSFINKIDDAVFLNLACVNIDEDLKINLIVDSGKKRELKNLNFESLINTAGGKATIISDDTVKITDFIDNAIEKDALFAFLLFCYFVSGIVIIEQWLKRHQKEILVCKMIGIGGYRIFLSVYIKFILSVTGGIGLAEIQSLFTDINLPITAFFSIGILIISTVVFFVFFLRYYLSKKRGEKIDSI